MINGNLEQFLDTGWYNEATLYYNGNTYWCEGYYEKGQFHFRVDKYKSKKIDDIYTKRDIVNGKIAEISNVLLISTDNEQQAKEIFLKEKLFDGKSFWEVHDEIAWFDEEYD